MTSSFNHVIIECLIFHLNTTLSSPPQATGDALCVFDPHARFVPGATAAAPGRRFSLSALAASHPSQVEPFTLGGAMAAWTKGVAGGAFPGALFRLPLRGPAAAAGSAISSTPCSGPDILALMKARA